MTRSADERLGFMLVMVVDVLWGIFPIITHHLVQDQDPLFVAGVACLFGSIPFWLRLGQEGHITLPLHPTYRWPLVKVALLATVLSSVFFFTGAAHTSGLNASLLSQSEPIYAIALSGFILGERLTPKQLLGAGLLLMGAAAVLMEGGSFQPQVGDILVLISPVFYQLGHLVAKGVLRTSPTVFILPAMRLGLGGGILLAIALLRSPDLAQLLVKPAVMAPLALYGVVIIGLEKWLWYEAIKRIDLGKASALLTPSVGVGALGAWLILGEVPRLGQLVGLGLLVAGLLLISLGPLITGPAKKLRASKAQKAQSVGRGSEDDTSG